MKYLKTFESNSDYFNLFDVVDSFMDDFPSLEYTISSVKKQGNMKNVLYPFETTTQDDPKSNMIALEISESSELDEFINGKILEDTIIYKFSQMVTASGVNLNKLDSQLQFEKIKTHLLVSCISERTNYKLIYACNIGYLTLVFQLSK